MSEILTPHPEAQEEENQEEVKKKFKVIQGGKAELGGGEPPKSSGTDWLTELPDGTIFLAKQQGPLEYLLHQFQIVEKSDGGNIRLAMAGDEGPIVKWFAPVPFCKIFKLSEVLGVIYNERNREP